MAFIDEPIPDLPSVELDFRKYHPLCREAYEPGRRDTFAVGNDCGFLHTNRITGEMIVAIAGSNDPLDWLPSRSGNARLHAVRLRGAIYAHEGFARAAEAIWKSLESDIRSWLNGQEWATVTFCGHSRGGAIAQLMPIVAGLAPERTKVVTFASPKCLYVDQNHWDGTEAALKLLSRKTVLFEQWSDIVPRLPLSTKSHPYQRIGVVVRKDDSEYVERMMSPKEDIFTQVVDAIAIVIQHPRLWQLIPMLMFGLGGHGLRQTLRDNFGRVLDSHLLTEGYNAETWWTR